MKIKAVFIISLLLFISEAKNVSADVLPIEKSIVRPNIIVSATIGIPKMKIWGYGAPNAVLELIGEGVNQQTTSANDGYYSFALVYLPDKDTFPELCVTELDEGKRATPPTCIPPIEIGNFFYDVGPVIIPPTISLGAPQTHVGSQVSTQGQTIPNSDIDIKLARPDDAKGVFSLNLVRYALAYYIPSYTIKSDAKGNYSFNMPIDPGKTWRVFAITHFEGSAKSPKSNTLKFETLSSVSYLWKKIISLFLKILSWPGIIFFELLLIALLLIMVYHFSKRKGKKKHNRSLMVERYQRYIENIRR